MFEIEAQFDYDTWLRRILACFIKTGQVSSFPGCYAKISFYMVLICDINKKPNILVTADFRTPKQVFLFSNHFTLLFR